MKNLQHKEHISVVLFEIDMETGRWPGGAPMPHVGRPPIKRRVVERAYVVRWGGAPVDEGRMRVRFTRDRKMGGIIRLDKEGIEWARGWTTEAARALHVAAALS